MLREIAIIYTVEGGSFVIGTGGKGVEGRRQKDVSICTTAENQTHGMDRRHRRDHRDGGMVWRRTEDSEGDEPSAFFIYTPSFPDLKGGHIDIWSRGMV